MVRRLLVFDSIRWHARQRGAARYFHQVAAGLDRAFGDRVTILSSQLTGIRDARRVPLLPTAFRGSGRLQVHRLNERLGSYLAGREHAAVVFSPYYGQLQTDAAEVFTVHDMIHERFPDWLCGVDRRQAFVQEKARCCARAALCLAVSAHTAQDLLDCYPWLQADRVRTIPLGVDDLFFAADDHPAPRRRPYFLYVGDRWPYKNFPRLIRAFGVSGLAGAVDLRVVSGWGSRFSGDESASCRAAGVQDRVILHRGVSDTELRQLYRGALALVFPSEYEGFGLPLLEAMASGTVVASSRASVMPEVGGAAPLYFDPKSTEAMVDVLRCVTDMDGDERGRRIALGQARAAEFPWAACAAATAQAIGELL